MFYTTFCFKKIDINNDGELNKEEFLQGCQGDQVNKENNKYRSVQELRSSSSRWFGSVKFVLVWFG